MNAAVGTESKLEPKRLYGIALVVFALVVGLFLDRLIGSIIGALRWNNPFLMGGDSVALSALIGFVLAISGAVYCYFSSRISTGGLNIATELKRVTWPSAGETRVSTIAVIIASFISALIFLAFDFVSSEAMTKWIPHVLRSIAG